MCLYFKSYISRINAYRPYKDAEGGYAWRFIFRYYNRSFDWIPFIAIDISMDILENSFNK